MIYRPDIDGLRAIAVVAVFLFHAHIAPFTGGFVGVDVFFVISGYLIASILISDITAARYSYFSFLYRRARRIVPALLLVIIASLPFAWAWLFPRFMVEYARTFLPATLFYPNIQLGHNVHYAATVVDGHPLVHTWTLGVEAQFYLIFPIVFVGVYRRFPKALPYVLILLASLSFGAMLWQHFTSPVTVFFLFQYRAWEFLAGALVATSLAGRVFKGSYLLPYLGLLMVFYAIIAFDAQTPFPSALSLLPVLGTALVMAFLTPQTPLFRAMSMKPLVGLGLISYSFYLFHQPVLVFARARHIGPLEPIVIAGLFLGLILVSYLSWRFVEQRFRGNRHFGWKAKMVQVIAICTVALVGFLLKSEALKNWGVPERFNPEIRRALAGRADYPLLKSGCLNAEVGEAFEVLPQCELGRSSDQLASDQLDFILIGDSYAEALAPGVSLAAAEAGKTGVFWGVAACPPILDIVGTWFATRQKCEAFKADMVAQAAALAPETVILHGLWITMNNPRFVGAPGASAEETVALYGEALKRTLRAFQAAGMDVVVILQKPAAPFFVPERLAKMAMLGVEDTLFSPMPPNWYSYPMNKVLFDPDVMRDVRVFDLTEVLCDATQCQTVIEGYPLMRDRGHLTGYAAEFLAPYMRSAIWPDSEAELD